ncbi:DUF1549 and DUF1553 domain-containing protein [Verrucomicrobia bacterium]|nr:DUF1549 and DUF1553 domain-containing protein [Verrucomicrobiota bacterium]
MFRLLWTALSRTTTPSGNPLCATVVALATSLSVPTTVLKGEDLPMEVPPPVSLKIHYDRSVETTEQSPLELRGAENGKQLLVSGWLADGKLQDFTRHVSLHAEPGGILRISPEGRVQGIANGNARVIARWGETVEATLPVKVLEIQKMRPLNFPNQVVPIFTKTGCNGGGCHGKSGGQNGFRLSLLGFEPHQDYGFIVKEARGRRISPAAPERSLLLLKATGELPHGGGKRMEKKSDAYQLLRRWIAQGMPYGNADDPSVERIEILPKERIMQLGGDQQLVILAHYSDGSKEDVTRSALYESNQKEIAKVDSQGWVQLHDRPGDLSIMVRYHGHVGTFRASIPLGAPVPEELNPNNFIDDLVFAKLRKLGIPPSERCDDGTFIRRVTLDLAGRLPTEGETRAFLAETSLSKRNRYIETLLAGPDYADFFAGKFSALLRNRRDNAKQGRGTLAFHRWIRDSFYANKPYDKFVREILTASGNIADNPPVAWYRQVNQSREQLEDVAQLFLATRLKCAQCHHHPYERWSQRDYYQFSAFFSQVGRQASDYPGEEVIYHKRGEAQATHPKTKESLMPAALGQQSLQLLPEEDPRQALANWMSEPDNPFFAPALVNRYWKHFMNRGLVEPEDDMRDTNPASNPELLAALARHFVEVGYDLKDLARQICQSRSYQLSSLPNAFNAIDTQHFSHHYPERLEAEVLLDAIDTVNTTSTEFSGLPTTHRAVQLPDNSFNKDHYFLTIFGRPDSASACECERSQEASLAQSLYMLNSRNIMAKLTAETGSAASFAQDSPTKDRENMQKLYLRSLSRTPSEMELHTAMEYINRPARTHVNTEGESVPMDSQKVRQHAFEDLVWSILNMKEFLFSH